MLVLSSTGPMDEASAVEFCMHRSLYIQPGPNHTSMDSRKCDTELQPKPTTNALCTVLDSNSDEK